MNELPQPKNQTRHPVTPAAGKKVPPPFALGQGPIDFPEKGGESQSKEDIERSQTDRIFHPDPKKHAEKPLYHLVLPIAFHSQTLSKTESRWVILEKEAFAVVSTLKKFEQFLMAAPLVYLLSDSAVLMWLMKAKSQASNKIMRWSAYVFSLPYEIVCLHVLGSLHCVPDGLSRGSSPPVLHVTEKGARFARVVPWSACRYGEVVTKEKLEEILNTQSLWNEEQEEIDARCNRLLKTKRGIRYLGTAESKELAEMLSLTNVLKAQKNDDKIKSIVSSIQAGEERKGYQIKTGILYRKRRRGEGEEEDVWQIVLPSSLLGPAIAYYHFENHAGARALYALMRNEYYYYKLKSEIVEFTRSCHLCLLNKHSNLAPEVLKSNTIYPCRKNEVWSIDIVQGFTKYKNQGSFLTAVEFFSSFTVVHALKTETAEEVANAFETRVIANWGAPRLVLSDGASNMAGSKKFTEMLRFYGIKRHITTAFASKTNGRCEQRNLEVANLIRILTQQLDRPWPQIASFAQLALNSKASDTLGGQTPQFIMTGLRHEDRVKPPKLAQLADYVQTEADWHAHVKLAEQAHREYMKVRDDRNKRAGGKQSYWQGKYIHAKDFSKRQKKKQKTIYVSSPEKIEKDF